MAIVPELAEAARERLARLKLTNVHLREGDGSLGWPEAAPFQGVLLTAAPAEVPDTLLAQLAPAGRLIAPVGAVPDAPAPMPVAKPPATGRIRIHNLFPVPLAPTPLRS